jgi:hypothetical protein
MRFNQLHKLKMFLDGGLWFARIDTFRDALEGSLPERNLGLLEKLLPQEWAGSVVEQYRLAALRSYASCWHMSDDTPSAEIWNAKFGDGEKGIAIRTTPAALNRATKNVQGADGPLYFGVVRYIDHKTDEIPEAQSLEAAFVVQDRFAFQREARLLIHAYGRNAAEILLPAKSVWGTPLVKCYTQEERPKRGREFRGFIPEEAGPMLAASDEKAIVLPISPVDVIDKVLVGRRMTNARIETVQKCLGEQGLLDRFERAP